MEFSVSVPSETDKSRNPIPFMVRAVINCYENWTQLQIYDSQPPPSDYSDRQYLLLSRLSYDIPSVITWEIAVRDQVNDTTGVQLVIFCITAAISGVYSQAL